MSDRPRGSSYAPLAAGEVEAAEDAWQQPRARTPPPVGGRPGSTPEHERSPLVSMSSPMVTPGRHGGEVRSEESEQLLRAQLQEQKQ